MMPCVILATSPALTIGVPLLVVMVCLIAFLVRNRQRCPRDGASMDLVPPPQGGHHLVFRCTRCGLVRKTHLRVGRR